MYAPEGEMAQKKNIRLTELFAAVEFRPNPNQLAAIQYMDGPLFLTAGPGSGKTRVLLWRTVNLLVCKGVPPERIFLSTFTEKAAHQLKEGLRYLLAIATAKTGEHYDISGMAIGTVHSICRKLITDRRFAAPGQRPAPVVLLDGLSQYFQVSRRAWDQLIAPLGMENAEDAQRFLNTTIEDSKAGSKHLAVLSAIKAFNRFAEESILPGREVKCDPDWERVRKVHAAYLQWLAQDEVQKVDLSLLQQQALKALRANRESGTLFDHVIVDEYQDTNSIQEELFFHLAKGSTNITVVGDDDQALYRFRGATVENLVEFPQRCMERLGVRPCRIDLNINYRSRSKVVEVCSHFIDQVDWKRPDGGHYRVQEKNIKAHRKDVLPSVVVTDKADKATVYAQLAAFIHQLKHEGKINDFNEVAVLFPSVKPYMGNPNAAVTGMRDALQEHGIPVYAPRAGRFLETEESTIVMGLLRMIIGTPHEPEWNSAGYQEFRRWLSRCRKEALVFVDADPQLKAFIADRKDEKQRASDDLDALQKVVQKKKWAPGDACTPEHVAALVKANGLSTRAIKSLSGKFFRDMVANRLRAGTPLTLRYVLNRTTALDWNVLDLFHQLCGFKPLRDWMQRAEDGNGEDHDEGPICNLALISQYLGRYQDEFMAIVTGYYVQEERFANSFFRQFCYAIWRLGESEYENDDDPFPRGRVPFLTIHQSKGLEFKVVILGNMGRKLREPSPLDVAVRGMLAKEGGEPLERQAEFDAMRLFYVALSRAKDLLVFVEKKGGHVFPPLKCFRELQLPALSTLDIATLPDATTEVEDMGKAYSFTGDYTSYLTCPRQYMVFDKYGFVPSRQQTRMFGHLVHRTVEDLHQFLIAQRNGSN